MSQNQKPRTSKRKIEAGLHSAIIVNQPMVRNFSTGGLSAYTTDPVTRRYPVSVRIGEGRPRPALVRHVRRQGQGFLIGLQFTKAVNLNDAQRKDEFDRAVKGMTW